MGFSDKLKGGYFFFEDKWYSVLDKINTKAPVYKAIDPIDRVIPSFILFLLLVLFIIILMGYLIQFASPYEVTIITHDSSTKILLSSVVLDGELNGELFNGKTNSEGEYSFSVEGPSKNFFGMFLGLFFPGEPDFGGFVSADKDGYTSINRQNIDFTSTNHKLYLEALPITPDFPNSTVVVLQDSSTNEPIVSSDSYAYVKFKCNNKTISVKTVRDDADGTKDGKYTLSEEQCQFVVTKAFSTGYQVDSIQKILPKDKSQHTVSLDKKSVPTTGTAKVYIYDINSPDTNRDYLNGIKVYFNNTTTSPTNAWTNNNGVAEKTLEAGTYTITITDQNYYEITSSDNITIDIEVKDEPTELSIGLEKIILSDKRQVYFKVVDSVDSNVISGVTVDLLWLNKDINGNYFGTDGDSPTSYNSGTITPTHTDSNGLFKSANVTVRKDGELVAILKKENYVYKMFKPTFFEIGSGPETITLAIATAANSGKAKINVEAGDNNRPLVNATAYLYDDLKIGGITIPGIPFEKYGITTDSQGSASYSNLPIGSDYAYSAEAKFGGVSSGLSSRQFLDANQTITFNIHMNLDVSYFEIELYDFETKNLISTNLTNASVKLYVVNDSDFTSKTLSEEIEYKLGAFTSNGYDRQSRLAITVDLNGYASYTYTLDGVTNPLLIGLNKVAINLIPLSMIDGNVDVFFEGIYADSENINDGNSSVSQIDPSQSYKVRFLAVTNGQEDFSKLLALERTLGKVTISGVAGMEIDFEEQNAFTCDTIAQDVITTIHDDNYYFPTGTACNATTGVRPQAGFKWSNGNLPAGTYSYIVTFEVNSDANFGDKIKIQYRAKETHATNIESESALKEKEFEVSKPFTQGIHFIVDIEGAPVTFNANSNISKQVLISPNSKNDITIRVYNHTKQNFSNAKLSIYSHAGDTNSFDPTVAGNGLVHFDTRNGDLNKVISSSVSVSSFSSEIYNVDAYPEKFNSSNWIVIVLQDGSTIYKKFIDAKAWGKELTLDAEFIAGIRDQIFDGTVYPRLGDGTVKLTAVTVEVGKNCKESTPPANLVGTYTATPADLNGERFFVEIPGMYEYQKDCVYVTVNAKDETLSSPFNPIFQKRIMAGSGKGRDPALSCVDVADPNGETDDTDLEWNENKSITVRNNCGKTVNVSIETGLICERDGETNTTCSHSTEIGVDKSKVYNLTGRNANYEDEYPDFKDTIGLFPFNIKAMFAGGTGIDRWILADGINVHLTKEDSCFSISEDSFDFVASGEAGIDFTINSYCQYEDLAEYFFPKTTLHAFGFDINALNKPSLNTESFEAKLIVTGKTYETYTEDTNILNYLSSSLVLDADTLTANKVPDENYTHYTGARFDLNDEYIEELLGDIYWAATKFQFQFFDKNPVLNGYGPQPYGVAVDGDIIINYTDGTKTSITPRMNFELEPDLKCIGDSTSEEYCDLTKSGTDMGDNDLDVGLFYVLIPKGKVDSIDINFIGGDIANNLLLKVSPYLEYTRRETKLRENVTAGEIDQNISLGTYSIYPIEGAEFIIKHIDDLNEFQDAIFTGMINPRMYLASNNPKVLTWVEQGYLKAKYIGSNIESYDDQEIELTMEKTFGGGINYSILNVQDFVDLTVANDAGKSISGVK